MKNRTGKLSIIEPWELGTDKAIDVSIIDQYQAQYLISLSKPLLINSKKISYLIGELRLEKSIDLLSDNVRGVYSLNMVYSDNLNEHSFRANRIKDFRSSFLLAEISLS